MNQLFSKNNLFLYCVYTFASLSPYLLSILYKKYIKSKKYKQLKKVYDLCSLSKLEAKARSEIIKNVSYTLFLSIVNHKDKQ